ncbi:MAG: redox-sensing transcriptional repressor Rex [Desulfobacterales bacterium S7086C20]|nr:MAG: redox-sensing transcriptional repressor Rex [Desulfobacterales bacterium S7086C20]
MGPAAPQYGRPVKIPAIAISRLSVYARHLARLKGKGTEIISSGRLADMCGVNPAQIRKDLGYFGDFGVRGVGYYVQELLFEIRKILGSDQQWRLGLVGVGNLGLALLKHREFTNNGYTFVAVFDKRAKKIGIEINRLKVQPLEAINYAVEKKGMEIGVIAVKPVLAQEVADILIRAGIHGILNFSPVQIECPMHVSIENVDFSIKLEKLCYKIKSQRF